LIDSFIQSLIDIPSYFGPN